jgi:hypothetical protein
MSTRRVGLLVTLCVGQIVACAALGITAATPVGHDAHLTRVYVVALLVSGILGAGAYGKVPLSSCS